jgi:hypothetical protein
VLTSLTVLTVLTVLTPLTVLTVLTCQRDHRVSVSGVRDVRTWYGMNGVIGDREGCERGEHLSAL